MLDEPTLDDDLGRELHALVDDLQPRAGLADAAIARRRSTRRRAGVGAGGLGAAAAVSAGVVIALGSGSSPARLGHSELHLAAYKFALPRDATTAAATPAACALGTFVTYPNDPDQSPDRPGVGASAPDQPAISSAVTGQGGCVSMLITDPYTPGSDLTPSPAFPELNTSPIMVDGDSGTIGTQEFLGGENDTINGVHVPSGTTDNELTLTIPAADGQDQLLVVTAAGISQSELQSIVVSGLDR
jgi:hypothetical protein